MYNKCAWKKLSGEYCNQCCVGKYCAHHNHRFKKGAPGVINCAKCDKILKGKTPLCAKCGSKNFRGIIKYYRQRYGIVVTVEEYLSGDYKRKELKKSISVL